VCRKEWADLKSVAGTKQLVSFGSRREKPQPTLRKADAKPANPDVYPNGWDMNKVRVRDRAPINRLVKLQDKKADDSLPLVGLRDGRWKLIAEPGAAHARLFDLETDPAVRALLN
jgi:hypothetical protein